MRVEYIAVSWRQRGRAPWRQVASATFTKIDRHIFGAHSGKRQRGHGSSGRCRHLLLNGGVGLAVADHPLAKQVGAEGGGTQGQQKDNSSAHSGSSCVEIPRAPLVFRRCTFGKHFHRAFPVAGRQNSTRVPFLQYPAAALSNGANAHCARLTSTPASRPSLPVHVTSVMIPSLARVPAAAAILQLHA